MRKNFILKLLKSLYSLSEAPFRLIIKLGEIWIVTLGFKNLKSDTCFFVKENYEIFDKATVIAIKYFYGFFILSNIEEEITHLISNIKVASGFMDEGVLEWHLEIFIMKIDHSHLALSQVA